MLRDFRLGLRTLAKAPGLTVVSIIALTFGIGLTTMMFSIIYGAMLVGLPFEDGHRIMAIARTNPERDIDRSGVPMADFADLLASQQTFSHFGAYTSGTMNVSGNEKAERYQGTWITHQAMTLTGVQPLLGRSFVAGEDTPAGAKVALLSYGLWQSRYGGASDALGQVIRVNGVPHEIIGVMPEGFEYPQSDGLWLPLQTDPLTSARDGQQVQVVGKLKPEVTIEQAVADLNTTLSRIGTEFPETSKGFQATIVEFTEAFIGDEPRQLLLTMLGAVFFVLLIACSNVANLLLDRAAHRSKEVGVRTALGASRGAIIRIFLSEAFVLALGGTVLGIGLAYVGIEAFNRAIASTQPPFFIQIGLFPPVLAFATGVALLATLFSGLIPALQASRPDIAEVLKDESRGASSLKLGRMSKGLVVFEVALSCGLLVAAGLMVKSVARAGSADTGFEAASVFTTRVGFPAAYTDTVMQARFFEQLDERVNGLPGVHAAAIASGLPGAQQGFGGRQFALEGATYERDVDYPEIRTASVTPRFFETLDIPLRQGRLFTEADRAEGLQVAIVTERFVREFVKEGDPIGRRVKYGTSKSTAPWLTIVGVIPDIFVGDPEDPRPSIVIRPFAQERTSFAYVAARSVNDAPMALADPVRTAVASVNPDIPTYWPMTLTQAIAEPLWFVRVFGTMFMIFGFVALFLASIGLYAVMSFSVSRRSREVGIRMALGASGGNVLRMILKQGAWQLGIGLVIGLLLAGGISRFLSVVLFDVQPLDPQVFGGVAFVLALTGIVACLLPARRATLVDPADAMRTE